MLKGLDLKAKGVLLTLLCYDDKEGVRIALRKFAKENGLSHQQIRTIINKLVSTGWVTHLSTLYGTQGATHLTFNPSKICDILKNIKQHIQPHIKPHNENPKNNLIVVSKKDQMDWENFVSFFNSKVKSTKIPQVRVLTESRKRQIRGLLKTYSKQDLVRAIDICVSTPFLRGDNDRGWTVNIDWIYTEKHFVKIMEGNYDWQRNSSEASNASGRGQGRGATLEGVANEILRDYKAGKTGG